MHWSGDICLAQVDLLLGQAFYDYATHAHYGELVFLLTRRSKWKRAEFHFSSFTNEQLVVGYLHIDGLELRPNQRKHQ